MIFKKLYIQNFQSHKDTVIDFTSGLNVIVGATDSGKSSIIRALKKLIRDEPGGKNFISTWASEMLIKLEVIDNDENDLTITRRLTSTKNLYYVDSDEYGGFGKTIPVEVQQSLNMTLITLESGEKIDLYFSDQHDLPFMISKGAAGTRSKLLGIVAGLHILDSAISRISADIRAKNTLLKYKCAEKINLEYDLNDIPSLWYELELLDTLSQGISQIKQWAGKLKFFQNISDSLDKYNTEINELQSTIPDKVIGDFESIRTRIEVFQSTSQLYDRLKNIIKEVKEIPKEEVIQQEINTVSEEIAQLLKELKICPTCKQDIK